MNSDTAALIAQAEAHRVAATEGSAKAEADLARARDHRVVNPGEPADEGVALGRARLAETQEELATAEAEIRVYAARAAAEEEEAKARANERYEAFRRSVIAERVAADAVATAARERLARVIAANEQRVAEVPIPAAEYEPRSGESDDERRERIRAARWRAFDREVERRREPREPG